MVISKYLTLHLEKCQLLSQNSSVAVIIEYPACILCNIYMGLKPLRPKYLFKKYFLKVKQLICKISVLITSEVWTMEKKGQCQLIAVAVTP